MKEENKLVFKWQVYGMLFIMIVGSLLHFLYEWTGSFYPIGAISAVNESVWEHLKMGFWPVIFFAPLEYRMIKEDVQNFIVAKTLASYIIPLTIIAIFYSYTAILGRNFLLFDGLSFIIAIIIGQIVSFKILTINELNRTFPIITFVLICLLGLSFVFFTYFTPELPIFRDSQTGFYGISA
ncbi:MAG: hypothetical protein GF383_02610 [Candidatus Lokiarchaeota archaeon]|nr:hypothetical protein [Candidatus Lokiarchaeota archaeon]MBD3338324.1 hypothetical protein [Candidatus Lokiarchaeota archaeon]